MQVFVKARGNGVLNGRFYRVGRHSRAQPFSKARSASPIIPWVAPQLSHPRASSQTGQGSLPKGRLLPVLPVRMRVAILSSRGIYGCQRKNDQSELGDPAHIRK